MTERPGAVLGRILTDLGATLVEVVAGRPDPDRPVGDVLIHDPGDEPASLPGAVVLGVGVYGAEPVAALIDRAHRLGAAAVVVRSPVAAEGPVVEAVARTGLSVLGLTPGVSWAQVAALLRAMLTGEGASPSGDDLPSGDLFALANATAGLVGGPVTIEDRGARVLAFSSHQSDGDEDRIATILDRQVSADKLRELGERGDLRNLYRSEGHVLIEGLSVKPRAAIAVRAGGEILGSIWVVVDGDLSAERARALREAAKVAALHLLRQRVGEDAQRRLHADLLATVLDGGTGASQAAAQLGIAARPACVLAVAPEENPVTDLPDRVAAVDRIAGALALHLSAVHPHAAVASLGGIAYAVLPTSSDEHTLRVAEEFVGRIGARIPALIGIGRIAAHPGDLRRSRTDADRALGVLARGRTPRQVARLADVYVAALLDELADRIANDDDIPDGPVVRLRAYDATHQTAFTESLAAWLDSLGDVAAASAAVHVHPNTFRYRLKRLAEISGLDLADPQARFEAMVQLRLVTGG